MSETLTLAELDASAPQDAARALLACCGSTRWAREMAARRPFGDRDALFELAAELWGTLEEADWLEAFAAHPRIGDRGAGSGTSERWSRQEQGAVLGAVRGAGTQGEERVVMDRLAAVNRAYEERFGFVFLICATGKSAREILAAAEERVGNDIATELATAGREQSAITRLRLEKLLR